jgi:flagellar hook-length control protein FliK
MTIPTGPKGPTAPTPGAAGGHGVKNKAAPSADAKAEGFTSIFATQQEAQQKPPAEAAARTQDARERQDGQDRQDEKKMQKNKSAKGVKNTPKDTKDAKDAQGAQGMAAQAPASADAAALLAQSLHAKSLSEAALDSAASLQSAMALEAALGQAAAQGLAPGQSADALQKSTAQALARAASAKTGGNNALGNAPSNALGGALGGALGSAPSNALGGALGSAATTLADSGAGGLPVPEAQAEVGTSLDATLAQTVKALAAQIRNASADQALPGADARATSAAQAAVAANGLQGPQGALAASAKKQALADANGLQNTFAQALEQRRSDGAETLHLGREQALRGAQAAPELAALQGAESAGNKREVAYAEHSVFAPAPQLQAIAAQEPHGVQGHAGSDPAGSASAAAPTPEPGNPDAVKYWISPDVKNAQLQVGGLGEQPLDVRISMRGNEAQVAFLTDEAQTRDALQDASAQLQDMFQREGVLLGGVSVGGAPSQGFGAGGGAQQSQRDGKRPPAGVAGLSSNARSNAMANNADAVRIAPTQANGLAGKGRSLDLFV